MIICETIKCTGCFSCMNICPTGAISSVEDRLGKTIPFVNQEKCIKCEACKSVCPSGNNEYFSEPIKCYSAIAVNEDVCDCSSSGAAYIFGKQVIKDDGVVYGVHFNEQIECIFSAAYSNEDLHKFKGSKYVQAYTGMSYKNIKENLKARKKVLYVGTPCQVHGLKCFLKKDYDNLITVDLICHGTPPSKYLKDYVNIMFSGVEHITFRGKNDYKLTLYKNNDIVYCKDRNLDLYFAAFTKGLIMRDNCYDCKYAKIQRCGDITIGDCFIKSATPGKKSLIIINNNRGLRFLKTIEDSFLLEEVDLEEAANSNRPLSRPLLRHKDRDVFEKNYGNMLIDCAIKNTSIRNYIFVSKIRCSFLYKKVRGAIRVLQQKTLLK